MTDKPATPQAVTAYELFKALDALVTYLDHSGLTGSQEYAAAVALLARAKG